MVWYSLKHTSMYGEYYGKEFNILKSIVHILEHNILIKGSLFQEKETKRILSKIILMSFSIKSCQWAIRNQIAKTSLIRKRFTTKLVQTTNCESLKAGSSKWLLSRKFSISIRIVRTTTYLRTYFDCKTVVPC